MQEITYATASPLPFTDRTPRLITIGIILTLGACMCGCFTAAMPIAMAVPRPPGQPPIHLSQLLVATLMYVVMAAVLGTLGIGLILRRRWARPLTIIFATHVLIVGVITTVCGLLMLPLTREVMTQAMAAQPNSAQMAGFAFVFIAATLAVMALVIVVLPVTILLLLKHPHVRSTVEHYDTSIRWTDRVPPTVVNMAVTLAVTAAGVALWACYATVPVLNFIVHGVAAVALVLAVAALLLLATRWVYRLDARGWWLGMLTVVGVTLLMLPSIFIMPLPKYYAAMGIDPTQMQPLLQHATLARSSTATMLVLITAAFVAYMIRSKKAFDVAVRSKAAV